MIKPPDISLALCAIRQDGRDPEVVSHSWWVQHRRPEADYLVLSDETYRAWVDG